MNPHDQAWQKLVSAARQVRDDRDPAAPYGFATRVAALAMAPARRSTGALLEQFSWRALGIAALLAVIGVAASYPSLRTQLEEEPLFDETAVTAVFDIS